VPNNYYRMLRVLQIVMATGQPRSKLNLDTKAPLDYDIRCFYLDRPRISLYRRIDLRCEQMLQGGMLQVLVRASARLAVLRLEGGLQPGQHISDVAVMHFILTTLQSW
jgi:tRNA A37 N6-isopentenylltransferase MiaA